jgi:phage pi2 protein 07
MRVALIVYILLLGNYVHSQNRSFDFFGIRVDVLINQPEYDTLVKEHRCPVGQDLFIKSSIKQYQLDDWAIVLFLKKLVDAVFAECTEVNKVSILSALLSAQNINNAIGIRSKTVHALLVSVDIKAKLINTEFFEDGGYKFIPLNSNRRIPFKLKSIQRFCKEGNRDIQLNYRVTPSLNYASPLRKVIRFYDFNAKMYDSIQVSVSKEYISYSNELPRIKPSKYYYKAPTSPIFNSTLFGCLNEKIKSSKSMMDSINFLLRYTQTSVQYEDDKSIYGINDFASFPETTVYVGKGDCEDKCQLFAFLLEYYFKDTVEIVFLLYPNHVQVGVYSYFFDYGTKYYVEYKGKKYLVSEPSADTVTVLGDDFFNTFRETPIQIEE